MRLAARSSARVLALPLAGALLLAPPLAAQSAGAPDTIVAVVTGVVWAPVNVAVAGARVTLARPGGAVDTAITDDDGTFRFKAVRRGPITVQVRRVGFAVVNTTVDVPADGAPVMLELTPSAPLLAPVVVRAVRATYTGPFAGFYQRRDNGFGHFITRAQIERRNPMRTTDLFRMVPGARMGRTSSAGTPSIRFRGANCDPDIVLDGMPLGGLMLDLDVLAPGSLEGIEVYAGAATVPPEFRKGFGRAGCGMIVIWTRHGEPRAKKRGRDEPVITATALAELVAASQVYTADQVDVVAAPTDDISTMMAYPDSLRGAARVAASAVVEFVVDAAGAVEAATINFVAVPARPFIAALRGALPSLRFTPAAKNGMAVRQVVQLAVQFDPKRE